VDTLTLPEHKIGMIVVTPSDASPHLTEDKHYTIIDIEGDWLRIKNDIGDSWLYRSHLFIEADVYYNMLLWIVMCRIFGTISDYKYQ